VQSITDLSPLFTAQNLCLSGVAFLWYQVHQPDGTQRGGGCDAQDFAAG
jgi:hypothetical protein